METSAYANSVLRTDKQTSLTDLPNILEKACQDCKPLTAIACVTGCKTWKLKNQLRNLRKKTRNPDFKTELLNTLKNRRRLQILELVSKQRASISCIQQRLRRLGFDHSQQTIIQEYVDPLVHVGLVDQDRNLYYATIFGCKMGEITRGFDNLEHVLPVHSKCYEEMTLNRLMKGPKTYGDLKNAIRSKSIARVLSRLQNAKLAETNKEKDYIFFFKTKRKPEESMLSPTESRVYDNISQDGISARKLAKKAEISLRRTYKYLRKLKGKKLVFTRKKPVSYRLTAKGSRIALMLEALHDLTNEISMVTEHSKHEESREQLDAGLYPTRKKDKNEEIIPLAISQPVNQD